MTVGRIPRYIYHLTDATNWPAIKRDGLLSAHALLDRAEIAGAERERLERQQRPDRIVLPTGATLHDQKPLPSSALQTCLIGVTPEDWYALLNAHAFFWIDLERLNRLLCVRRHTAQAILVVEVSRLVERHAGRLRLTPINTGNARRRPAFRGRQTFVPYGEWMVSGWSSEAEALGTSCRPPSHRPVEVAVVGGVPDMIDLVVAVHRCDGKSGLTDVVRSIEVQGRRRRHSGKPRPSVPTYVTDREPADRERERPTTGATWRK